MHGGIDTILSFITLNNFLNNNVPKYEKNITFVNKVDGISLFVLILIDLLLEEVFHINIVVLTE